MCVVCLTGRHLFAAAKAGVYHCPAACVSGESALPLLPHAALRPLRLGGLLAVFEGCRSLLSVPITWL